MSNSWSARAARWPARAGRGFGLALLLVSVLACLLGGPLFGQTSEQKFRAHLSAGEFSVAGDLARANPAAADRDRWLRDLAQAQTRAGARGAALRTAGDIGDDLARAAAYGDARSQPLGRWLGPTGTDVGGLGGGSAADFDSLIELITSTVAPTTWEDVGGPGAIDGFEGGVYVDGAGVLRKLPPRAPGEGRDPVLGVGVSLDDLRVRAAERAASGNRDPRVTSPLRKVSLPRLENALQARWAAGLPPTETMRRLAGLQKIRYVLVYPETGDLVLAGPAAAWAPDGEGRAVAADTGRPVLCLDDLVVLLRNAYQHEGRFGCSITPRAENLARAKAYLEASAKTPLKSDRHRETWLGGLREALGKQDVEVYGVDPRTRVGRVLVEADYRMKLVGMGLEEGVLGVTSYLDLVKVGKDGAPPPMEVLRWWFTLKYDALLASPDRLAFEPRGQGARVLSENEFLTERGERVHTGKSAENNAEFARAFTHEFPRLATKYPVYADLENIFDLALAASLLKAEDLPGQVEWRMAYFGAEAASAGGDSPGRGAVYEVELGAASKEVESVINHRLIDRKHVVAGVSGGVTVRAQALTKREALRTDARGELKASQAAARPQPTAAGASAAWWWD